ncbi:MAG: SDR family oxidoreductase, partial [Gaiellaceae bacterium]
MGRVSVVTGASSGIGAEIARLLAARGDLCILLARRVDRLEALAEELGGEAEPCDVSDHIAVESVAARVLERHPRIDLLVNNAGIPGRTRFLDGDPEQIERLIRINYLGAVWCLRAFLPGLRAAAPSNVVNIVSVSGVVAGPPSGPYSASKHAQLAFSRTVAAELR